jgi:beta-xylosidase
MVVLAGCSSARAVDTEGANSTRATPTTTTTTTTTTSTVPVPTTTTLPPRGSLKYPARIIDRRNLPDPFVLKVPGGYQLYASSTAIVSSVIPTAFSTSISHWPAFHSALPVVPPWAVRGFTWAPDVRYLDGRYVMYFDSIAQPSLYFDADVSGFSRYAQCIGIATSSAPGGPFVGQPSPLICDFAAHGAIDPRTFLAADARLFLDWKSDDNAAYPSAFPPTNLYAQQLSLNGLSLAGPAHLLMSSAASWQEEIVEAPDMVEVAGRYWLFYSGSWFNSPTYGIGYAVCKGPIGPCKDLEPERPWLGSNREGAGPGEESLFRDSTGQWWMVYAPWYFGRLGQQARPLAMALVGFSPRRPYIAAWPATATS